MFSGRYAPEDHGFFGQKYFQEVRLMSVGFENIVGNVSLKQRLSEDISRSSLAHAYVVEGCAGSGRRTLALSIVAALCCEHRETDKKVPCASCKNCRKILEHRSPDVVFKGIEDDRVTIGIETIREIKNDVYIAPNDLDVKAYIIENADSMTEQAQNAFLILLESPPPYALFFLICENSTSLLETVRSRAPALRMERLTCDDVREYLLKNQSRARALEDQDPRALDFAVFCGDGSIGASIDLLDSKRREKLSSSKENAVRLISMLSSSDKKSAFSTATALSKKRTEAREELICMQSAIRDLILLKKSDSAHLCFFADREEAAELATHYSSSSLFALYDASKDAISSLEAGANVRLTLFSMMQRAGIV